MTVIVYNIGIFTLHICIYTVLLLKSHSFKQASPSVAQCRAEPLEDCDDAACVARKPTWMCCLCDGSKKETQMTSVVTLSESNPNF